MDLRFKEPQRYRAVLIDAQADREAFLESLLADRGIVIVGRYGSGAEAATMRSLPACDLVIVYHSAGAEWDGRAIGPVSDHANLPILFITESDSAEHVAGAVAAGADAVLSVGASTDRLRVGVAAAIASFERAEAGRQRAAAAERALAERKSVERAKGILMQQRGIAEADAYREIQRQSMHQNQPLAVIAERIIAAKELLG